MTTFLRLATNMRSLSLHGRSFTEDHFKSVTCMTNLTSLDFGPDYNGRAITSRKLKYLLQ